MLLSNSNSRICYVLPALLLCCTLSSCYTKKEPRQTEPAFYYWKSVLNITGFEQQQLGSLKVKTIYIKFFDVAWDETLNKPLPVAKLQASNYKLPQNISVIPTVFITNECIQKIDSSQIKQLAENIYSLIIGIKDSNGFDSIPEIQIDCDWTEASKGKYFQLLANTKHKTQNFQQPYACIK